MEPRLTRRAVIGNIASLFSGSVIAQGMTSLALLLTARQLGADLFGQYTATITLASITGIIFSLGLDTWLLREGGRRPEELARLVGSVFAIKAVGGAVWVAGLIALAGLLDSGTFPRRLLELSAFVVWFDSLFATTLTAFKAALRNQVNSALEAGSDTLLLVGTLVLIGAGVSAPAPYFLVRLAILAASLGVGLLLVQRATGLLARVGTARMALRKALPFAASDVLAWAYMRADLLVIAAFLGEREVGLYAPAVGIVNALFLVPAAVHIVIVPVLSRLFSENEQQAWLTAWRSLGLLLLIGTAMTAALYLGAQPLTSLLGPSFEGAGAILRILSVILLIHALSFGLAAILVATGRQAQRSGVQALAVVVNLGLNVLVIQRLGVRGVAWVYVITEIVLLAGYAWLARRAWLARSNPGGGLPTDPRSPPAAADSPERSTS